MDLEVEQHHVYGGTRKSSFNCPVAKALSSLYRQSDFTHINVTSRNSVISSRTERKEFLHSEILRDEILSYDLGDRDFRPGIYTIWENDGKIS